MMTLRVFGLLTVLGLCGAEARAAYYGIFSGGYDLVTPSNYSGAFKDQGFSSPKSGIATFSSKIGNEAPGGIVRLAALGIHSFRQSQETGSSFADVSLNRAGFLLQMNPSPAAAMAFTFGLGGGLGWSRVTVLGDAAGGVYSERYFYVEPVIGAEIRANEDFRFFVEGGYVFPFAAKRQAHGDALGLSRITSPHLSISAGLSFYFVK